MTAISLNEQQRAELKKCQLEMLKAFAAVCEKLGISYFLDGGTLLGAVRHKGFIPWDDDIDVGMLRADYERFFAEGQALLPEHYFIQNISTDPQYTANFAKMRDSRTTYIETTLGRKRINHGVFIDIFVLDYYPEKAFRRWWMECRRSIMKARQSIDYYRPGEPWSVKRLVRIVAGNLARVFYPSVPKMLKKREAMIRSVPAGPRVCNYCGIYGRREIHLARWYEETCELEFEGERFLAPKMWHEVLTQFYGDYMTPPPPEQQVGHHYALAVDTTRPYTEYLNLR